ncbi:MAG: hypothetical protein ACREUN_07090 [Burkholderiales bacterium]
MRQEQIQIMSRAAAIQRAVTIMGGLGPLAARLKIPERQLDYWMRDIGTPPDTVFFDVIDVIIDSVA